MNESNNATVNSEWQTRISRLYKGGYKSPPHLALSTNSHCPFESVDLSI